QEGQDNLVRFQTNYFGMAAPDIYYRFTAGYFEEMFGGYGTEVIYRPRASRWAISTDVNYVRQRAYDQRLDFLNYTVTTGHLNVYYDVPWKDLHTSIHIGQFLAGDRGAQFRVGRRFDSGVFVGSWFTLTNVPFEEFGEGSFDKGFFFVIPFELFSLRSSRASGGIAFRPLTRDGGQMLNIRPRLYDLTSGGRDIEVTRDWDQLMQ
ncbi:MAG: YjbH domain-containing protein, partial [Alphaproteobacteria bacterium]|nr:YjbH domain-containing protein [Alphaproteobacteria bacterium]